MSGEHGPDAAPAAAAASRIIVVGYGMAGHHLVARLTAGWRRGLGPAAPSVTVLGAEPGPPYNRVLLPEVLAGRLDQARIDLAEPDDPRVVVRTGVRAVRIDRGEGVVHGDDGSVLPFDALVLATGANAVLPPLGGIRDAEGLTPGVHTLRAVSDLRRLVEQADAAATRRAVVVGGGLLGVQCARALTLRGLEVVLIHQGPHLLDHRLDPEAGSVLLRTARQLGIEVHLECRARSVARDAAGRLIGVRLADGFLLEADLILLACGSSPATSLAARAGIEVRDGVLVDESLRSLSDPRVYAVGDCARLPLGAPSHRGLAAPALEQAEVVAARLLGEDRRYRGASSVARLSSAGVDIAILEAVQAFAEAAQGSVRPAAGPQPPEGPGPRHGGRTAALGAPGGLAGLGGPDGGAAARRAAAERRVCLTDPFAGTHRSVTVRGGRLIGSVLIGDVSAAGRLAALMDRAGPQPLPADPLHLLFEPPAA